MIEQGVTDDPLTTGWTFSQSAACFADNGTVSGHRQLQLNGSCLSGDNSQIQKTVSGLANGSTSFTVTILPDSGYNMTGELFADGVSIGSAAVSSAGVPTAITGTATVSGGQCVIKVKLTINSNLGPVTAKYDIYSMQLSQAAVTASPVYGSFVVSGQAVTATLLRHFTVSVGYATYVLTGYTLGVTLPTWSRQAKNSTSLSALSKNSTSFSAATKNSTSFSAQSKS